MKKNSEKMYPEKIVKNIVKKHVPGKNSEKSVPGKKIVKHIVEKVYLEKQ